MIEDRKSKSSVGVIGAGIQGICVGLNLIKKGWISAKLSKNDLKFFRKKIR